MTAGPRFRITIDRDVCMGTGNCELRAPDIFYLDEGQIACVRPDLRDDQEREATIAAQLCPTSAITIHVEVLEQSEGSGQRG